MPVFIDQTGHTITISNKPDRIISLVPSQTELLFDLGLNEEVVGITKFCIHPEKWFRSKPRVGGTKQLHLEKIRELQPDLIIANKEENLKEQIEVLQNEFPVWTSDIADLDNACAMIKEVGSLVSRSSEATHLLSQIQARFADLPTTNIPLATTYLIWKDPYMTVGGDTFIHSMMKFAGFRNVFSGELRYPEISLEQIRNSGSQLLLLSSEPFPFKQKHIDELQSQLPGIKILLVDGEMFSWYGSRLIHAPAYFSSLNSMINYTV